MFVSKVFSFFFVCLLAVCGCSVSQTEGTNQTQQKEKAELSLTMERSQCLGNCPVYKLEVLQNGKVSSERFSFSDKDFSFRKSNGKIESTLNEEKINQLIAEIDKTDFFSLKNDYTNAGESGNCATDNPTVILSIKLRGKEKQTKHDLGCTGTADLEKLVKLENKIDEIVETKRRIGERK